MLYLFYSINIIQSMCVKVMGRVVKRFLLHNNRENEEVHDSSFDVLKQDVQMIRFEMLANL